MRIQRDILWGATVFLVAFLLRVPFFWYPGSTVFDEGIYATYISNIIYDRPYFELHPPLPNIIMAGVAHMKPFDYKIVRGTDVPFGAFPYVPLRFINVFLGSLLVVAVYVAARFLWEERWFAILAGFGVALDNALIVYSRTFLPDTMLVFFGMAGITTYLWHAKRGGWWHLVLASIFFGAALSTKWIGLAFLGTAMFASLVRKRFREVIVMGVGAGLVYVITFFIFFGQFSGGFLVDRFSFNAVPALSYPAPWNIGETLSFLPRYTKIMYKANYTVDIHPYASKPWQWPLGQGRVGMWDNGSRFMILLPNTFGWGTVFVSVLFACVMLVYRRLPKAGMFALTGYLISFVPFIFIGRPFFMYHYFMALVFGWLLVPWVVGELRMIVAPQMSEKKFLIGCLAVVFAGFLLAARSTYGI